MSSVRQPSVDPSSSAARVAVITGAACLALGSFFLVAWFFDESTIAFASSRMKTNTSLGLALVGGAIAARGLATMRGGDRTAHVLEHIALVLATLALALALATGAQHLGLRDLGIDELLAHDPDVQQETGSYPNRMAPNAALSLGALAIAVVAGRVRRLGALSHLTACLVLGVGMLAMLGYAYGVPMLYRPTSFIRISPFTSAAAALGSIGALALRTDVGLSRLATSEGSAGLLTRQMLLVTFVVPVALGWLRLEGERRGVFPTSIGTALLVLAMITTFAVVVVALARSIEAHEATRRAAE